MKTLLCRQIMWNFFNIKSLASGQFAEILFKWLSSTVCAQRIALP